MKNVVNLTLKFTIDHYLIGESRFKNEKYCFEKITYFNLNLLVSAYRVSSYAELYSSGRVRGAFVGTTQTSQIFKMIFLYCKAFPASEKTKLSSAQLVFIQNST